MQGQKPATASEQRRLSVISELWCVPCAMMGWDGEPATVQHVVEGRTRLGHEFTYGSCPWHHLGMPAHGINKHECAARYGPSLAEGKRTFQRTFGSERTLVLIQNQAILLHGQVMSAGGVFTEAMFGDCVRQEAYIRLNRSVQISR